MKLLIVDDDTLICDSLQLLFQTQGWEVHTAENGQAALDSVGLWLPDIVLMDIRMPVCDGVQATRLFRQQYPDIKIVILTTFMDDGYIASAMAAGAEGYLLKSTPADAMAEHLRAVYKGAAVFHPQVAERLTAKKVPPVFKQLSERENAVLECVAQGLSNNEIAAKLYLSQGTVRNIISSVLDKLELRDRTQLAVHYWKSSIDS